MTATTPDEPTTPLIDAVAIILCKRELRKDRDSSFDDIVAPGRELWMRYRYEATDLLDDLERAGLSVTPTTTPDETLRERIARAILRANHGEETARWMEEESALPWRLALKSADAVLAVLAEQHEPLRERQVQYDNGEWSREVELAPVEQRGDDREALVAHIRDTVFDEYEASATVEEVADGILDLLAGFRLAPAVEWVTSAEGLDALPEGSWIGLERHGYFTPYERGGDSWQTTGGAYFDTDWLPAKVLYRPEQGDDR